MKNGSQADCISLGVWVALIAGVGGYQPVSLLEAKQKALFLMAAASCTDGKSPGPVPLDSRLLTLL